jgi:ABC-2 type transport system ATP-binding protein
MSLPLAEERPIVVRGLRKRYHGAPADTLCGLDLEVRRGEVFCMLGPNGAGKSTTLEILEGVRVRTAGEVSVLGADPADYGRRWRARIGVVPQSTGIFADLTVREVVEHYAAFYPAPLPVGQAIEMVGLGSVARRQSTALSGGQRRRLDVAVGVVGDPDLIFLDEPTTGLDPVARHEAWDLVRFLAERGKTTMLTTHYLDEAEALADRVGVVADGRMVQVGTVTSLRNQSGVETSVGFSASGPLAGRELPPLPEGTTVEAPAGAAIRLRTGTPTAVLDALLPWAHSVGVDELPDLRVHRPSLEEVYLEMIKTDETEAER